MTENSFDLIANSCHAWRKVRWLLSSNLTSKITLFSCGSHKRIQLLYANLFFVLWIQQGSQKKAAEDADAVGSPAAAAAAEKAAPAEAPGSAKSSRGSAAAQPSNEDLKAAVSEVLKGELFCWPATRQHSSFAGLIIANIFKLDRISL